jgi:hypothetical protein
VEDTTQAQLQEITKVIKGLIELLDNNKIYEAGKP